MTPLLINTDYLGRHKPHEEKMKLSIAEINVYITKTFTVTIY